MNCMFLYMEALEQKILTISNIKIFKNYNKRKNINQLKK